MKLILCGEPGGEGVEPVEACLEAAAALQVEIGLAVDVGRVESAGSAGGPGREERPWRLGAGAEPGASEVLRMSRWESDDFDFWAFDRLLDRLHAAGEPLVLQASWELLPAFAAEVATRAQRLANRRNRASSAALFDRVLARHGALHDLDLPLVRADYDHALDVWQWVQRLAPEAGLAVQLAALFHDVERLESEAEVRREEHGPAYQGSKDAHAERGARMAAEVLAAAGVDEATCERTARLIAVHEGGAGGGAEPGADAALLADADALSFFSLNSPGYLAYHGPEATRRKVLWTRARLRPAALERLAKLRLPSAVRAFLAGAARRGEGRSGRGTEPDVFPLYLEEMRGQTARTGSPPAATGGRTA